MFTIYPSIYRSHPTRFILFFSLVSIILFQPIDVFSTECSVSIKSNPYTFHLQNDNKTIISMEDFGILTRQGYPRLPSKVFYIALPCKAQVSDVHITPIPFQSIPDPCDLVSTKPLLPAGVLETQSVLSEHARTKEHIYNTDAFFPASSAEYLGVDYLKDYPIVKIRFTPFTYNPVRKALRFTGQIDIHIDYEDENAISDQDECFLLENGLEGWNDESTGIAKRNLVSSGQTSLLIISSQTLEPIIRPFLYWKSFLGHTVEFVSTEQIVSQITGDDKADQIRNFLKEKPGITHVLLIGDTDIVPMKILYPDPNKHYGPGAVPSDFYFAQLSGDWDTDGDGFPGEFGNDDVDLIPEISVGRIPWSDTTVVKQILEKTIRYEKNAGIWKEQALLMGAINNYKFENHNSDYFSRTDAAVLMELLKGDIFQSGLTRTLYEKQGISPSVYPADMALNRDNIFSSWTSGSFGCITWWSHGAFNKVTHKWWKEDNGNQIPESHELVTEPLIHKYDYPVNETYPPIIFADACDNGWPEKASLGRELIKNGSAGVVSASRSSWYLMGWDHLYDGGDASLTYFFWDEYIQKQKTLGEAAVHSKLVYIAHFWGTWQHVHNIYTYNCYGDPTLMLTNPEPIYGGLSGTIVSGDNEGTPLSGVTVALTDSSFTTTTDENGSFQFLCVPGGLYGLIIDNGHVQCDTMRVNIINGEIIHTDIQLPSTRTDCESVESILPKDFVYQNYPNPFNGSTLINFTLSEAGEVSVTVYNANGQLVKRLVDGHLSPGMHSVRWNSQDVHGLPVPSGLYFYEIVTPHMRDVKKMTFLK